MILRFTEGVEVTDNTPTWLPEDVRELLRRPTMPVPTAGKLVHNAERGRSYALARAGVIPTLKAGRRREVPTVWVRQQLMLDEPAAPHRRLRDAEAGQ
jgi:hypothetical protein